MAVSVGAFSCYRPQTPSLDDRKGASSRIFAAGSRRHQARLRSFRKRWRGWLGSQGIGRSPCRPRLVSQTRWTSDLVSPPVALLQPPAKFPPCPCLFRVPPSKPPSLSRTASQLCLNSHTCTIVYFPAQHTRYLCTSTTIIASTHRLYHTIIHHVAHTHKPRRLLYNLAELRRALWAVCV